MGKYRLFLLLLAFSMGVTLIPSVSFAGVYTFSPTDNDLAELPHEQYFTWGIKWTLPTGEVITGATITYNDIWDWTNEFDRLYTHLLNTVNGSNGWTAKSGYYTKTIVGNDSDGSGDSFSGQGILLGDTYWDDPVGGYNRYFDLAYTIPSAYFSYLSDGIFGFGIDPNCHYYNSGITVTITTEPIITTPVPEPGTLLLLGFALVGVAGLRKRAKG